MCDDTKALSRLTGTPRMATAHADPVPPASGACSKTRSPQNPHRYPSCPPPRLSGLHGPVRGANAPGVEARPLPAPGAGASGHPQPDRGESACPSGIFCVGPRGREPVSKTEGFQFGRHRPACPPRTPKPGGGRIPGGNGSTGISSTCS